MKIECVGKWKSYLAKIKFDSVIAEFNDKHMLYWFKGCQAYGIGNSPLNIMINKEMVEHYELSVDGTLLSQKLGFTYKYPKYTMMALEEQINFLVEMNYMPNVNEAPPLKEGAVK